MVNNVVIGDVGNDLVKGKCEGREMTFRHAVMQLSQADYECIEIQARGSLPEGYIRVNGVPYAFGEVAEKRNAPRLEGASRYTKGYYDILLAAMLASLYKRGGDVIWFGSHAPQDAGYGEKLARAAFGNYHIEYMGGELNFRVIAAYTFDEPVGGLMNVLLREDGLAYAHADVSEGDTLVIDIGGYTTDYISVADGKVDYVVNESERVGIREVVKTFERSFRMNNLGAFQSAKGFRPEQLRRAIATGVMQAGGREYNCLDESREATNMILAAIEKTYTQAAGGPTPWRNIILTGGGSAMLYNRLKYEVLNHGSVHLADPDFEALHLANVRGGMKLFKYLESEHQV